MLNGLPARTPNARDGAQTVRGMGRHHNTARRPNAGRVERKTRVEQFELLCRAV